MRVNQKEKRSDGFTIDTPTLETPGHLTEEILGNKPCRAETREENVQEPLALGRIAVSSR